MCRVQGFDLLCGTGDGANLPGAGDAMLFSGSTVVAWLVLVAFDPVEATPVTRAGDLLAFCPRSLLAHFRGTTRRRVPGREHRCRRRESWKRLGKACVDGSLGTAAFKYCLVELHTGGAPG